jgi:hypothetical protein
MRVRELTLTAPSQAYPSLYIRACLYGITANGKLYDDGRITTRWSSPQTRMLMLGRRRGSSACCSGRAAFLSYPSLLQQHRGVGMLTSDGAVVDVIASPLQQPAITSIPSVRYSPRRRSCWRRNTPAMPASYSTYIDDWTIGNCFFNEEYGL